MDINKEVTSSRYFGKSLASWLMPRRPVVKFRRSLWGPEDEGRPEIKCRQWPYVLTYEGVEVLPALAQDSLSQAEISLHSVTENLADRPTRPSPDRKRTPIPPVFI